MVNLFIFVVVVVVVVGVVVVVVVISGLSLQVASSHVKVWKPNAIRWKVLSVELE